MKSFVHASSILFFRSRIMVNDQRNCNDMTLGTLPSLNNYFTMLVGFFFCHFLFGFPFHLKSSNGYVLKALAEQ